MFQISGSYGTFGLKDHEEGLRSILYSQEYDRI